MPDRSPSRPFLQRSTLIVVAVAACVLPYAALAAEGDVERTLALIELRTGPDANSLTLDYMREVVAAFREENPGDYILVPAEKVAEKVGKDRDQVPGAVTDERKKQLAEMKKKGIKDLDNADAVNAIKALTAAERAYGSALAAPGADDALRKEYLDVLAQLATAYVVAKDGEKANDVFRTVITTFGLKAPITDDYYRPDVVKQFQDVVKATNAMQKGALEVSSQPLNARIILSGGDRGATPGTVSDLIPGIYALRLQHGSSSSMLHRVKINGGATTKIHIDVPFESHLVLEGTNAGLAYADLEAAKQRLPADAATLGRDLDVNFLVLMGVIDQKLIAYVVDAASGRIERSFQVKVPQVGVSKRAITRVIETILGKEGAPAPVAQPWYSYTPGVAVGGAGAVSLLVGLYFAATSFSTGDKVVSTQSEKDSIETGRTVGAVTLGLGAVLGGVAGYMFWSHANAQPSGEGAALLPAGTLATIAAGAPLALPPAGFATAPTTFRFAP